MHSRGVFDFARTGPMAFEEATDLVGVLTRITQRHSKIVNALIALLEGIDPKDRHKTDQIEAKVNREIEEWNTKVKKLGGLPKGLWLVDIDAGDGYYCWKFPEVDIGYWHDYKSGFSSRIPLSESPYAHRTRTDQSSPR